MSKVTDAIIVIDEQNAQKELNHIENTQGTKYQLSDAEINAWMDA